LFFFVLFFLSCLREIMDCDWSGKYSPAPLPVTDCNGFTHGTAGSYFGNWWSFNQSTGGVGKTGHCGNNLSLGCCK